MCIVVFQRIRIQQGPRGFVARDPVAMVEDGEEVGRMVDPATNPSSSFELVYVPGSPVANLVYSLEQKFGPEVNEVRPLLAKRAYELDVGILTPGQRSGYIQGDDIILTEAEYIAAVVLKP